MPSLYKLSKSVWEQIPAPARKRLDAISPLRSVRQGYARFVRRWAQHDELYTKDYFEFVERSARESAPIIAQSIVGEFAPGSALDFGCGSGALLVDLRRLGVAVRGFDYSEAALTLCRRQNLDVGKFDLESSKEIDCPPADIVISTEVAEHLPESCADRYVAVLCSKANTIIFTAATPGQGGRDHVNEQPHQYWLDKFAERGFRLDHPATFRWRAEWEAKGVALWYHRNLMILRREA